ncbi:MAG: class I SAM-dependent methyltransferase [Hymenobacteraceae bacterium]|nr:class I SAM-dependent methyltransferase [Hymenobacteraceae bacterium]MDX5397189.1 class I SAM-dependent methyltransferase [Hymenobacteraceae bacterium]MDX5442859.1 class I SAM-dependent methyltransferase [Hymenobacteraceae bacterium]MDX5513265.1 class I SAM-dependent methyltransferase [Hymenobacteraceae bacterium]
MKDNFSAQSKQYAAFRPGYPAELVKYLVSLTKEQERAWDCATGNGQMAVLLSEHFAEVQATDISQNQLFNATPKANIHYSLAPAEETSFPDHFFDLITVAQAVHWFNFDMFYKEARRVLKPGGIIALIGYGLLKTNTDLDAVIHNFYSNITGPFWDAERRYLDEEYKTIPFPFSEIELPEFEIIYQWSEEDLLGYLGTWSAVQHYKKAKGEDPLLLITSDLEKWFTQHKTATVTFPLFTRTGIV